MAPYAGMYLRLAISKSDFPQLLRVSPDGPEPLRPLPQVGLVVRDADVYDDVVLPSALARLGAPGHGLDDELDRLKAAARGAVDR